MYFQMGVIYSVNENTNELYTPATMINGVKSSRFSIATNTLGPLGEGPTTWSQLVDTINFFAQPNAPPPFLIVTNFNKNLATFMWQAISGTSYVSAFRVTGTIKSNDINALEYISVGDVYLPKHGTFYTSVTNMTPYPTTEDATNNGWAIVYAHKKIVVHVPVARNVVVNEIQTVAVADVRRGTGNIPDMYYAMGSTSTINSTAMNTAILPAVLKMFLTTRVNPPTLLVQNAYSSLVYSNASVNSTLPKLLCNSVRWYAASPTASTDSYYINKQEAFNINPSVSIAIQKMMEALMTYNTNTPNSLFQLNGPWLDAKTYETAMTLAKVLCDSTGEPLSANYRSFCSCLGRKDVETKLRELLGLPQLQMACVSKACQNAVQADNIFKPQTAFACSPYTSCFDLDDAVYAEIAPYTTNLNKVCAPPPPVEQTVLEPPLNTTEPFDDTPSAPLPVEYTTPPAVETPVIYTSPPAVEYTTPPAIETALPPVEYTTAPAVEYTTPPAIETALPPVIYTTPPAVETSVVYTTPPAVEYTTPPAIETALPPVIYTTPPAVETPVIYTTPPPVEYTTPPAIETALPPVIYTTPPAVEYTTPPAVDTPVMYTTPVMYITPPVEEYNMPPAVELTSTPVVYNTPPTAEYTASPSVETALPPVIYTTPPAIETSAMYSTPVIYTTPPAAEIPVVYTNPETYPPVIVESEVTPIDRPFVNAFVPAPAPVPGSMVMPPTTVEPATNIVEPVDATTTTVEPTITVPEQPAVTETTVPSPARVPGSLTYTVPTIITPPAPAEPVVNNTGPAPAVVAPAPVRTKPMDSTVIMAAARPDMPMVEITPADTNNNLVTIVGASVGGIVLLALIIVGIVFLVKYLRRKPVIVKN